MGDAGTAYIAKHKYLRTAKPAATIEAVNQSTDSEERGYHG